MFSVSVEEVALWKPYQIPKLNNSKSLTKDRHVDRNTFNWRQRYKHTDSHSGSIRFQLEDKGMQQVIVMIKMLMLKKNGT